MLCCFRWAFQKRGSGGQESCVLEGSAEASNAKNWPGKASLLTTNLDRRSWLSVDCDGDLTLREVDISGAAVRCGLAERDLSLADPSEGYKLCPVKVAAKSDCLLVCIEGLRAVISKEEVLILSVPAGTALDEPATPFSDSPYVRELLSRLRISTYSNRQEDYVDKSLPFQLVVLEWILSTVLKLLTEQVLQFEASATPVLDQLVKKVSHGNICKLRHLKFAISDLLSRIERIYQGLHSLMDDVSGALDGGSPRRSMARRSTGRRKRSGRRRSRQWQLALDPPAMAECASILECNLIQIEAAVNSLRSVQASSDGTESSVRLAMKLRRLRLGR